jgi:putative membrane protein
MKKIGAGLVAGLFVSMATLAGAGETQPQGGDGPFIEQALAVNELELDLGKLAVLRAASLEVKAMGEKMVEKHTQLGKQLSQLAQQSGVSGTPSLSSEQRAIVERVSSQNGPAFDKTFKSIVDDGHVKELAMYRAEVDRASNPELRALAQDRVTKLQATVAQQTPAPKKKKDW